MVTATAARAPARLFYVAMAAAGVLIAFGGFIPTYWAKLADGSFQGAPILHLHGALFFSWTLFFLAQTSLVAAGRTPDHRAWGLFGISLATAMGITIVIAAINSMKVAEAISMGDAARRFSIVSLSGLALFAGLIGTAIAKNRDSETHKRLMVISLVPLLEAASARVFMTLFAPPGAIGPPPVQVTIAPSLFVDLMIVALVVFDLRTRKRVHPATLWGGGAAIAVQVLAIPFSATPQWMAIARWVESLAG